MEVFASCEINTFFIGGQTLAYPHGIGPQTLPYLSSLTTRCRIRAAFTGVEAQI